MLVKRGQYLWFIPAGHCLNKVVLSISSLDLLLAPLNSSSAQAANVLVPWIFPRLSQSLTYFFTLSSFFHWPSPSPLKAAIFPGCYPFYILSDCLAIPMVVLKLTCRTSLHEVGSRGFITSLCLYLRGKLTVVEPLFSPRKAPPTMPRSSWLPLDFRRRTHVPRLISPPIALPGTTARRRARACGPASRPRLFWEQTYQPTVSVLTIPLDLTQSSVCQWVWCRCFWSTFPYLICQNSRNSKLIHNLLLITAILNWIIMSSIPLVPHSAFIPLLLPTSVLNLLLQNFFSLTANSIRIMFLIPFLYLTFHLHPTTPRGILGFRPHFFPPLN